MAILSTSKAALSYRFLFVSAWFSHGHKQKQVERMRLYLLASVFKNISPDLKALFSFLRDHATSTLIFIHRICSSQLTEKRGKLVFGNSPRRTNIATYFRCDSSNSPYLPK